MFAMIARIIKSHALFARKRDATMELSIKKQKRTKESLDNKKKLLLRINARIRSLNVQQQTAQSISIQNVLRIMEENNTLNILTQTLYILDAPYIIAINVESVVTLCRYYNV
jgi:AAA15 family ATPase/GTPase